MTESISHNLEEIGMLGKELQVDEIPKTLLCNVHPLMMFQSKMKEICHDIHNSLGNKKIAECFLVDIEFEDELFVIKSLKSLSNFINNDYSSKPSNKPGPFATFIAPKENRSLLLKDHRFNRISECALVLLYHLDYFGKYLDKFTNNFNGVSILDRTFADMEILKPTYAAPGLLGIHVLNPYHNLMIDKKTIYSTLIKGFPSIYNELTSVSASAMLSFEQCFHFVLHEIFKILLPDKFILDELINCCKQYSHDVKEILQLSLKMFTYGFTYQKAAIFKLGKNAEAGTGTVLKISSLSNEETNVMDENKVQVHNVGDERGVDIFNHDISVRAS